MRIIYGLTTFKLRIYLLEGAASANVNYAVYGPRTSHLILRKMSAKNCNYGFFTYDSWLSIIEAYAVQSCISAIKYANDGSGIGAGTSLIATRVSASSAQIGFDIYGLHYSTFNSCTCDHATSKAYNLELSHGITLNSCGAEDITGEVLQIFSSEVVVNGFRTWLINGVTGGTHAYLWFDTSKVALNGCSFLDFTTPRDSLNLIVQNGATVTINQTKLPAGGNTWISYSDNSMVIHLDGSGITCKTLIDVERVGIVSNGKRSFFGSAAPTTGTWARGDIIYSTSPSASGFIG